jgi:RNA polymerase sigma factor (sigma-70 family)
VTAKDLTDGQLLHCFAARHDEAAFATLMERHGRLVLSVCRRVLHHEQDAEDAFQAAFLVLARKASSIRQGTSVAGWLYRVAHRTAVKAQAVAVRRRANEKQAGSPVPDLPAPTAAGLRELQVLLDEEVQRLPEKYRAPFVLCCLEGRSRAEAARALGWKEGTLSSRLCLARQELQRRLVRRGVTLSAALCAGALAADAGAAVPTALVAATACGALSFVAGSPTENVAGPVAALAEGVLQSTTWVPGKAMLAVVLAVCVAGAGAGLVACQAPAEKPPETRQAAVLAPPAPKEDRARKEAEEKPLPDGDGDPLPEGAIARMNTSRLRHGDAVRSLAFSPDGSLLASGSDDRTVRLWDVRTGGERLQLAGEEQRRVRSVAFSPEGNLLVSAHDDRFRIWDTASGKELADFNPKQARASCVAISRDGKLLACAGPGEDLLISELAIGKKSRSFKVEKADIAAVAFAPDNKTLALACRDKTIRLWDALAGKEVRQLEGHQDEVLTVAFSLDGKMLASGSKDKTICLWDPDTGKEVNQLKGHEGGVESVAFSRDNKTLASGSSDGTVRLWDAAEAKELHLCKGHKGPVAAVAFAPDGRLTASGGLDGTVRLWDVKTGQEQRRPQRVEQGLISCVHFSPDGKSLVSSGYEPIRVWETTTGRELRRFGEPLRYASAAALSPDGATLGAGSPEGVIRLWDVASGKELRQLKGHNRVIAGSDFSSDGRLLASAGYDDTIRLWDVAAGKELRQFKGQRVCQRVKFAPDGKTLASSSSDGSGDYTVRLWETETGKELWQVTTRPWSGFDIAFSPDGRTLAVVGGMPGTLNETGEVQLWDAATGKELRRFTGHRERVGAVAFSPDGRTLATGSLDRTVRLWEVATGQERRQFSGHQNWISSLAFSRDGRLLASSSADATALVWDATGRFRAGKFKPIQLSAKERESCWADLASDAGKAYRAVQSLEAAPADEIAPFLNEHLRPAPPVEEKQLAALIRALDSEEFETRDKAERELAKLGFRAEAALRKALADNPPLELRKRAESLLEKLEPSQSPEAARLLRAVEVLEHLGTPEAREALARLAKEVPGTWLEREAKISLERLARRAGAKP